MADDNPRIHLGANNPPEELTAYEAIRVHLEDLLTEARNWADGQEAESQAQVDEIQRLIDQLSAGAKAADEARVAEKKPLDEQIKAIQDRYNVYIAPLSNKGVKGKVPLAIEALNAAKRPFLLKREAELAAEREAARKAAEEAAAKAAEAARAAMDGDLEAKEAAELLIAQAHRAESEAKRAESAKAHAHGDGRASGLRSYWRAELTDRKAALLHYANTRPDELVAWLTMMAGKDVSNGVRTIPGFDVVEERR